ncbi:vanin-like protein 3 [Trichogramma pretiosum]|uniref:vanin-like protein 3 n=1 Tax=Trichogramma pretiosum TaxID=7493 RepID=UPI0006C9A614|nr:vanin-like protein 3 [Trichogramma pretiosum]XP_014238423.1 vanin-like protein 3 [Trichogramma pretiosum]XP_014238424.1 vanin-like protein 3 [Trichogramma pretiosum]
MSKKIHLVCCCLLVLVCDASWQASTPDSPTYRAAVVEYHPVTNGDDGDMIAQANANNYRTIIKDAALHGADIIVFPEFGLTSLPKDGPAEKVFSPEEYRAYYRNTASYIPHPNETVVLCDTDSKYSSYLQSISCAAREYGLYVVINLQERVDCASSEDHCPADGFLLYNSNCVFDRKGRVVARYRKYNPFNEPGTNVTAEPEVATFDTDFGVRFGTFICFDVLNEAPAMSFVRDNRVRDVVFTTHWFNELPFLDASQHFAAWSYAADVNFLVAGYSDDLTASGGSGVYAGRRGPLKIYNPRRTSNALSVVEVPKVDGPYRRPMLGHELFSYEHVYKQAEVSTITELYLPNHTSMVAEPFRDYLDVYTTKLLEPEGTSHITTLCDRGLCCDFHLELSYNKSVLEANPGAAEYKYRLVAFNGTRNFANASTGGIEVCALISCAGDRIADCGAIHDPNSTKIVYPMSFDSLIISRRANLSKSSFYMPNTMDFRTLEPMSGSRDFAYLPSGPKESSLLMMYLVQPRSDAMTFGIYGRVFGRDGHEETRLPSAATSTTSVSTLLVISSLLLALVLQSK